MLKNYRSLLIIAPYVSGCSECKKTFRQYLSDLLGSSYLPKQKFKEEHLGNLENTGARFIALTISSGYQYLKTGIAGIQFINKICVRLAILEGFLLLDRPRRLNKQAMK